MNKIFVVLGVASLLLVSTARAAVIGAYNTGLDNAGALLLYAPAPGTPDPHYTLTGPPGINPTAIDVLVNPSPSVFPAGSPPGPWLAPNGISQWIGPLADFDQSGAYPFLGGVYDYVLSVTANAGDTLKGRWASDNIAEILLEATSTGNSIAGFDATDFQFWHPFTITGLAEGANNLHFKVTNFGETVTGLRVEFSGSTSVPEPSTILLMLMGFTALLGTQVRRRIAAWMSGL